MDVDSTSPLGWSPSFSWGLFFGVFCLSLYYSNERSVVHRRIGERIFWACTYAWFGYVFFLLPDSPVVQLGFGKGNMTDFAFLVAMATLGLWMQDQNQIVRLASSIQKLDLAGLQKQHVETVAGRIATARIRDLVGRHQRMNKPTGLLRDLLNAVWGVATGRTLQLQTEVLEALQDCCNDGSEGLMYVLNSGDVDVPMMLAVAGTSAVLDFLRDHIQVMNVVTKAKLIDALQRQPDFVFIREQQELVVQLFRQTGGAELTTLKDLIDEGGDYHNLHKLVFCDLEEDLRHEVLGHLMNEACRLVEASGTKLRGKILSDIDDTLYSSGGHFPAGADRRFPKGQIYPGVLALFRELDFHYRDTPEQRERKASEEDVDDEPRSFRASLTARLFGSSGTRSEVANRLWLRVNARDWHEVSVSPTETIAGLQARLNDVRGANFASTDDIADVSFSPPVKRVMSNLVFLSARPHAYKDYAESKSYRMFRDLRRSGRIHCMPTLLAGRLSSSLGAALEGAVMEFRSKLHSSLVVATVVVLAAQSFAISITWIIFSCTFAYGFISARKHSKVTDVWRPVGEDKANTFLQYRQLYGECSAVFFGDNGQGDLLCGERVAHLCAKHAPKDAGLACPEELLELSSEGPSPLPAVHAVFIHEVIPRGQQLTSLDPELGDEEQRLEWARLNIHFHKTYVGAAVNAYRCDLISREALSRVGGAAVDDFVRMRIDFYGSKACWQHLVEELDADVQRANELLPKHLQIRPVPQATAKGDGLVLKPSTSLQGFEFLTAPPQPATSPRVGD